MENMDKFGKRSVLACPECHGVMWEINEGELTRYRCHEGHTYTAELLSLALDQTLRYALASASRALEERLALAQKLHDDAAEAGRNGVASMWFQRVHEYDRELAI